MGQKHKRFRESRMPFPLRDIRKTPRSMYARVPQVMAQFVLKIEKLSHIMLRGVLRIVAQGKWRPRFTKSFIGVFCPAPGPTPILEMARAYGLRPRLWLLFPLSP